MAIIRVAAIQSPLDLRLDFPLILLGPACLLGAAETRTPFRMHSVARLGLVLALQRAACLHVLLFFCSLLFWLQ